MTEDKYIQVGFTALRDPVTCDYLPAVPLYIKAEDGAEEAEQELFADIGKLLAHHIRAYHEICPEAEVTI